MKCCQHSVAIQMFASNHLSMNRQVEIFVKEKIITFGNSTEISIHQKTTCVRD